MTHPELTAKLAHEKWVRKGKKRITTAVILAWTFYVWPDYNMNFDYEKTI